MNPNGTTWEEETLARLEAAREEKEQAQAQVEYWARYIKALEVVLDLDRQRRTIRIGADGPAYDSGLLLKMSVKDALIEIASRNNGLLTTKEAVRILTESGRFRNRDEASSNVFSTLSHSKRYFAWERRGIYRLVKPHLKLAQ